jgi:uncharacterized membrane protein YjfL (UPF0719 family)
MGRYEQRRRTSYTAGTLCVIIFEEFFENMLTKNEINSIIKKGNSFKIEYFEITLKENI